MKDLMDSGLLLLIAQYDIKQQEHINFLMEKVTRLEAENIRLINQAADNATANDTQRLRDIIGGVYDMVTPTDTREKLLFRLTKILTDFEKTNPACKVHLPEMEFQFRQDYGNVSFHWNGKEFLQK